MKGLAKEGRSILFITHKLNEIMEVADRCTVLRKGKYIGTVDIADTTKEELSKMMVGRDVSLEVSKSPATPGENIMTCLLYTSQRTRSAYKRNAWGQMGGGSPGSGYLRNRI